MDHHKVREVLRSVPYLPPHRRCSPFQAGVQGPNDPRCHRRLNTDHTPIMIDGARPRSPCEERWGSCTFLKFGRRSCATGGWCSQNPPRLIHTVASPGSTALLTVVHDPRLPCEGSQGPCTSSSCSGYSRRRLSMESSQTTRKSFTGLPSWPIMAHHGGREVPLGAVPAATRALLTISSERSRDEQPAPTVIDGARPPVAVRGKWGTVHLPQVWARKLRNRGMVN